MLVEKLLPQARERLVTISEGAPLIEAAKLLRVGTDIVVVCDPAGTLVGVITKTRRRPDQPLPRGELRNAGVAGDDTKRRYVQPRRLASQRMDGYEATSIEKHSDN